MKKTMILAGFICLFLLSCEKFLDKKPDVTIKHPISLDDLNAILNSEQNFNEVSFAHIESGTDDLRILPSHFQRLSNYYKDIYRWASGEDGIREEMVFSWQRPYRQILNCNVVLERLRTIIGGDEHLRRRIEGDALFLRSFTFFMLLQSYSPPYLIGDKDSELGIHLRLSSDVNQITNRSSLIESYNQVLGDLKKAIDLLPEQVSFKTRPNKAAAYALMARIKLTIGDYSAALKYAEECLKRQNQLIDYNLINLHLNFPFFALNEEVIYHAVGAFPSQILNPRQVYVSHELYSLYQDNDLRKLAFFNSKGINGFSFKGYYSGNGDSFFAGLVIDEVHLIASESLIRTQKINQGIDILNKLRKHRFKKESFTLLRAENELEALKLVLLERRKELPFRGVRWLDLRRLNRDKRFEKTLVRIIPDNSDNLMEVMLPPNDLRYTYLIPDYVIEETGIKQNPR